MNNLIVGMVTRLFWWALPRIIGSVADYCDHVLDLVLSYESPDVSSPPPGQRRHGVLRTLMVDYPVVPEFVHRAAIEIAVLIARLGITRRTVEDAARLVAEIDLTELTSAEKRAEVLARLRTTYSDLPERLLRLLIELAVARRKGASA